MSTKEDAAADEKSLDRVSILRIVKMKADMKAIYCTSLFVCKVNFKEENKWTEGKNFLRRHVRHAIVMRGSGGQRTRTACGPATPGIGKSGRREKQKERENKMSARMRTIEQAAAWLQEADPGTAVTKTALRRLVTTGQLPSVRVGSKYLVDLGTLEKYLQGAVAGGDLLRLRGAGEEG